jgi:hypothetical protein
MKTRLLIHAGRKALAPCIWCSAEGPCDCGHEADEDWGES